MDKYREIQILENDKLAQKFAYEFCIEKGMYCSTFHFEDCLQCARIGLMKALKKYKPENGKISTYAWYYMYAECIAEYKKCKNVIHIPAQLKVPFPDFEELESVYDTEDDDNVMYEEIIHDGNASPEDVTYYHYLKEIIKEEINKLPARNRYVLIKRFGLDDGTEKTLTEIGKEIKVSGDRIRQIEIKGIRVLRRSLRSRLKIPYFDESLIVIDEPNLFEEVKDISYNDYMRSCENP